MTWPLRLGPLIALFAVVAAGAGVFWRGGFGRLPFTTVRGQVVDLFGIGPYRFDTVFTGAAARGTDAVTLLFAVPLSLIAARAYRQGSLPGGLLFLGSLGWFLYVYAGYALGAVAYNDLFLLYVALFSLSLFAFTGIVRALLGPTWAVVASLPRRVPAWVLIVSGLGTLAIWLVDPLTALVRGQAPPLLGPYTTLFTHALDLGVIAPAALLAGVLVLQRDAVGYVLGAALLTLAALLAPMIVAQTLSQWRAGVSFTVAEALGPIGGFLVLSGLAGWALAVLLRGAKR